MIKEHGKYKDDQMDFEKLYIPEDPALDARIKSFRKAQAELQEIMEDPFLEETRAEISAMMASQRNKKDKESYSEKESFVKNAFLPKTDSSTKTEFHNLRISKSDINELSAEWVKEWHKKKQMQCFSPADRERENFISASLKTENIIPPIQSTEPTNNTSERKSYRFHITSLAAAAALGILITIKALAPSGNTEKIFDNFYKPYNAVALVIRGENNTATNIYNQAVYNYKSGKYQEASLAFAKSASIEPSLGNPFFYIGLASMETGDYDMAVKQFSEVIDRSGDFVKESRWYLGLTYLKKGEKDNAAKCFKELTKTDGYFRKPAEKILRRLE